MAKDIFAAIDYFEKNTLGSKPAYDLDKFTGRFMNVYAVTDLIALGHKLVAASPEKWRPFDECDELEYVDDKTLRITKASGFNSEGELIHFNFEKNGTIRSIVYGGVTMWTADVYLKRQPNASSCVICDDI